MVKAFYLTAISTCILCTFSDLRPSSNGDLIKQEPLSFVNNLINKLEEIESGEFIVENTERIGSKYLTGKQKVVYQKKPFECKITFLNPYEGASIFFSPTQNKNAVYSPNGFPYFDIELDPFGRLMRKNNHHTIYDVGVSYIQTILKSAITNNDIHFSLNSTTSGFELLAENKSFGYRELLTTKATNLVEIAKSNHLSEYLILINNSEYSFYSKIGPGERIKIPSSYAKTVRIMLDKELTITSIEVFDDIGLFESYRYSEVNYKRNVKH